MSSLAEKIHVRKGHTASISMVQHPEHADMANKILDVIVAHGVREAEYKGQPYQAREKFLPIVLESIKMEAPVKLVLPAFPLKSPNRHNKVLGALPDLSEEIALENLQGLWNDIRAVYKHGAHCYITSDGLVYSDLLGVEDIDVWTYGETNGTPVSSKRYQKLIGDIAKRMIIRGAAFAAVVRDTHGDCGDAKVDFAPMYPCGFIIRPTGGSLSASQIPMEKVKQLSINLSPIVLCGFSDILDESLYLRKTHDVGTVLTWSFGIVQKVKDAEDDTEEQQCHIQ
ncbi:pyoverdine biosynthesis [Fusarium sporotrichioides]|uniref:Pyoverdine biosynthesis n=1 Tax=Fusarium sporotrichioides TaxID=5514 RepID=A0A395RUG2_FUSSP|nr:pyoverdine biosynthesis [Fusarium sporotrichioides]